MTLVIYKDHRIEIEYKGKLAHYAIFDPMQILVAEDTVELPKMELIANCHSTVDDYIRKLREYR